LGGQGPFSGIPLSFQPFFKGSRRARGRRSNLGKTGTTVAIRIMGLMLLSVAVQFLIGAATWRRDFTI
jgi:hypothetical protein